MSPDQYVTRLRIADQREIVNQIAQTYKDFYRAAMEYIDNAIDAAVDRREYRDRPDHNPSFVAEIVVNVDTKQRLVTIKDDCGGMEPQALCELLSNVGRSKKKTVPWANGQFGFGVHAFRAFAHTAVFTSNGGIKGKYWITIDRDIDENTNVYCEPTSRRPLGATRGTLVEIAKFDKHVFRKSQMRNKLIAEIERHFGDALRAGIVRIRVTQDNVQGHGCRAFHYESLPGIAIRETLDVAAGGRQGSVEVDLKVLEKQLPDDSRLPFLAKKGRRIQGMAYLASFRNFVRDQGGKFDVWRTLFVTGSIDVGDFCDPNITRDDLRQDVRSRAVYDKLIVVQMRLEEELEELLKRHAKASLKNVGDLISELLRDVLKRFRLQFEVSVPRAATGSLEETLEPIGTEGDLGGAEPGGAGKGPAPASGGGGVGPGKAPVAPGPEPTGAGGQRGKKSEDPGRSKPMARDEPAPQITFRSFPDQDRIIELGGSIVVNTAHKEFRIRNKGDEVGIRFDDRLLNYVSMVVAPPCVHRIVEKKGEILEPKEIANNTVNLAIQLERRLIESKRTLQSSARR